MIRYFFSYTAPQSNGTYAFGNFSAQLAEPIRDMDDVKFVADLITKSFPGNVGVIIHSWQRFEA